MRLVGILKKHFAGIKLIILFLVFGLNFSVIGQNNYCYQNYSIKEGLPSNVIYDTKVDSKGFLWFITDKGVVRGIGKKSIVFTTDNGLLSNDNFKIIIDPKDNVWVYSFLGVSKINAELKVDFTFMGTDFYWYFLNDESDNIFFSQSGNYNQNNEYIILKINANKNIVDTLKIKFPKDDAIYKKANHFCFVENNRLRVYLFDSSNGDYITCYEEHDGQFITVIPTSIFFGGVPNLQYNLFEIEDSINVLSSRFRLKLFSKNKVYFDTEWPDHAIRNTDNSIIKWNSKLLIPLNSKVIQFDLETNAFDQENFFKLKNCNGVSSDRESTLWFATLKEGIYRLNSDHIYQMNTDYIITKINGQLGNYIVGATSQNDIVDILKNKTLYKDVSLWDIKFLEIYNDILVYGGGNGCIEEDRNVAIKLSLKAISIYNKSVALASGNGISFSKFPNMKFQPKIATSIKIDIVGRMYAVLLLNNFFYSGNQQGLYWGIPSKDEFNPICLEDGPESVSVNGIKQSSDGLIWVSTEGKGVYVLKDKERILHFEKELLDGNIHSIKIDEKDNVWIATRFGVNKIEKLANGQYNIKKYTSYHGLPSDYVFDIYCYDDILYVATDEGLVKVDLKELDKINFNTPPPVYIASAKLVENPSFHLRIDTTMVLENDQNSIAIDYTGISYRSNGKISYKYRLLPSIPNWQITTNDNITFNNLTANKYTFEVIAINSIGIESEVPAVYAFEIRKHFTQTWWFMTFATSFLFLVGFSLVRYFNRRKKRKMLEKSENERVITELRLKSLQSQMNPHFIFNSLNAIQQFINVENRKSANDYLARFARLMRLYLGGSESQFISLKQELDVIRLYTELEHLRFEDKFQYEITLDESIDFNKIQVPAMLLQPYIENAIRHGLVTSSNTDNFLKIDVQKVENGVKCVVEDNGIGRLKSNDNKRHGVNLHRSLGNKISKERLEVIRALKLANISENITDLYKDGKPIGTRVEVFIGEYMVK